MNSFDDLDPRLQRELKKIEPTLARDASAHTQGKEKYLAQARQLAVTSTGRTRLNHWIENVKVLFKRKEYAPMVTTLISIFLILGTLLGGSGLTVAAAQSSQPGDFLYPVKTFSEDAYYQITSGDQNRLNLLLEYADRRVAEIEGLLAEGENVPEEVPLRLEHHLQFALELSVEDLENADDLLQQIRARMEETLNNRLGIPNPDAAGEALRLHVRDMLQVRISWIDDGLEEIARQKTQTQNQQQTMQPETTGEGQGAGNGQGTGEGQGTDSGQGVGQGQTTGGDGSGSGQMGSNQPVSGGNGNGMQQNASGLQVDFWADRMRIQEGECITLYWRAGWGEVSIDGNLYPPEGQMQMCPLATTLYRMEIPNQIMTRDLTITVMGQGNKGR